jgi:hypothetical protein
VQELKVTLPVDTINACLAALSKMPYEFAQPHIDMVRGRASQAMTESQQQPELPATPQD